MGTMARDSSRYNTSLCSMYVVCVSVIDFRAVAKKLVGSKGVTSCTIEEGTPAREDLVRFFEAVQHQNHDDLTTCPLERSLKGGLRNVSELKNIFFV